MWRAVAAIVLLLQTTAQPRASLEGHVVKFGTTEPVADAKVVLARVGGQLQDYRTLITDPAGAFVFRDLDPGSYRLYADRDGYLPTEFGQRTVATSLNPLNPAGVPIPLAAGQDLHAILIAMTPPGVISGRIDDNNREPMSHVWVRALKAAYRDGERTYSVMGYSETNDLGEYRLFGLTPGSYFVSAIPRDRPRIEGEKYVIPAVPRTSNNNRSELRLDGKDALASGVVYPVAFARQGYVTLYYPGTADPSGASSVEVRPGSTTSGIDMTITSIPTVSVRGKIVDGQTGQPAQGATVDLIPVGPPRNNPIPSASVSSGSFEFASVPSGAYLLSGQAGPPGNRYFAKVAINVVDRDVENLTLVLKPGASVTGQLQIEGGGAAANGTSPRPAVVLYPGYSLPPPVGPQGHIFLPSVQSGDYTIRVVSPNAYIKSALIDGADALQGIHITGDVTQYRLDIVVSYNTATMDILVLDDNRNPAAGVQAIVVPDPARRNRSDLFRSATTDATGRARLQGIPPGDYKVFASTDIDAADWQNPDVLRIYESRGEGVQLTEGGHEAPVVKLLSRQN